MLNQDERVLVPGKRPVGRPPKHGAYSKFALATLEDAKMREITAIMTGEMSVLAPVDSIVVALLAHVLAQIELIKRWLSENGTFQDEGKLLPQPILTQYFTAIKIAAKLCSQLGLTPESRFKLGRDLAQVEDIAMKIQRAKRD